MESLDTCHGACVLRNPDCSGIVADNLLHGDGKDYQLSDFVVMPNHVHVLAQFRSEGALKSCCKNWKHYTSRKINALLRRTGHFWKEESFDHLVRSPEQFEYLRKYISRNPTTALLCEGEYRLFQRSQE
jgi:hypothetical protein